MTPLLSAFDAGATLLLRMGGPTPLVVSAAQAAGAAARLAASLPHARHCIQCCTDTLELTLGTLAAWSAGQTVVMPSTRLAADVEALRARFSDSYVLDAAAFADAVRGASAAPAAADFDAASALLDGAQPCWPAFGLDPAREAIVLFTSGSTRAPQAHAKTWDALCRGAETFRRAFVPRTSPPLLAGSVDCHHMFGLEANLMAAIHCGYALCTDRPQLPADLRALIAAVAPMRTPLWLVTTPLQLSAFQRADAVDQGTIERVIVATMPLSQDLAARIEREWGARVDEIYGNTECGVMATRRTAVQAAFVAAPGIELLFRADEEATVARVPDSPMLLDDRVERCANAPGAFMLLGRRSDMVKVAGKRSTLRALDEHLRAIEGVSDGAFFLPEGENERVAAVAVAPALTRAQVLAALARRVDPAFLPRPLCMVSELPRDAQGKLARATLLAIAASASQSAGLAKADGVQAKRRGDTAGEGAAIREVFVFPASHPSFAGHFPGHPIVPGALLLAAVEGALVARGYRVIGCDSAKFVRSVEPDDECTIHADLADLQRVAFTIAVAGLICVSGALRCERRPAAAAPGPRH